MNVPAYEGNQPYIFISYAHKDKELVLPIIEAMTNNHFRVWYDEGIEQTDIYSKVIADHLAKCTVFVAFLSEKYNKSDNCMDELSTAKEFKLPVTPIYLQDFTPTNELIMLLQRIQAYFYYKNPNIESLITTLLNASKLQECLGEVPADPKTTAFCVKCGKELKPGAKFCIHCGHSLTNRTPTNPISYPKPSEGLRFEELSDGSYAVVSPGSCQDHDIVIPRTYQGNSVTRIGEGAFSNCTSLTSITIPDSVTSIGKGAFAYCNRLKYNEYRNGKYLGNAQNPYILLVGTISTNFTSFIFAPTVRVIGGYAFDRFASLKSITIPNGVIRIDDGTFRECTHLKSITIPESVTSIGTEAFYGCKKLTSITIPDSVKYIGNIAFRGCKRLTSVTIPDSVTSIGEQSFMDCYRLKSITIPNSVISIDDAAFNLCYRLKSITIPNSVTSIGKYAFFGCLMLEKVIGLENVERIDPNAFDGCPKLKKRLKELCIEAHRARCYVATCVYGSYDCPEVWTLRRYRDERLGASWYGRMFIRLYYAVSPTLVRWFGHTRWFKKLFKKRLDNMVQKLQSEGFDGTPYEDKI